jgi:hypothetical protein
VKHTRMRECKEMQQKRRTNKWGERGQERVGEGKKEGERRDLSMLRKQAGIDFPEAAITENSIEKKNLFRRKIYRCSGSKLE